MYYGTTAAYSPTHSYLLTWTGDEQWILFWLLLYTCYRLLQLKDLQNDVKFDSIKQQEHIYMYFMLFFLFYFFLFFQVNFLNWLCWPSVYFPAQLFQIWSKVWKLSFCLELAFGLGTVLCNKIFWLLYWVIITQTHIPSVCSYRLGLDSTAWLLSQFVFPSL